MPWTCQLLPITGTLEVKVDPKPDSYIISETHFVLEDGSIKRLKELPIGGLFYLIETKGDFNWPWFMADDENLSDYYHGHNRSRKPLFIILPGHSLFVIDSKCISQGQRYGGWQVTGEAPNITVSPSINLVGFYHGFLKDGVLSDDVEGRQF